MTEVQVGPVVRGASVETDRGSPCLLGISIGKGDAWLARSTAGWKWLSENFDQTAVLIGDSLQRITIEITEDRDRVTAAALAARRGEAAVASLAELDPRPLVLRTSEIGAHPNFQAALSRFTRLYEVHPQFRAAIDKDARSFCQRQDRRDQLLQPFDAAMKLSVAYLLEEVAAYEILAELGWRTEAYFGSELTVLAQIMKGKLEGVSDLLARRAHICLKYRKDS